MNKKQTQSRGQKRAKQTLQMRQHLWPEITNSQLWIRTEHNGFTTIPRTMPLIARILDDLAPKGRPISSTYLSLWCRVHDECVVTINNESEMAFEAGFGGERRISTWKSRMKILEELGFIKAGAGAKGDWNYVLILNPYDIIKARNLQGSIQPHSYTALVSRAQEIGADDLT